MYKTTTETIFPQDEHTLEEDEKCSILTLQQAIHAKARIDQRLILSTETIVQSPSRLLARGIEASRSFYSVLLGVLV
jgi:hypothetical protein